MNHLRLLRRELLWWRGSFERAVWLLGCSSMYGGGTASGRPGWDGDHLRALTWYQHLEFLDQLH